MALRDPYVYHGYTIDTQSAGYGGFIAHVVSLDNVLLVSLPMSSPEDADQAARAWIDQFQDFGEYDPPLGATEQTISQAHTFDPGDAVHCTDGTGVWVLADADNNLPCQAIVKATPTASAFSLARSRLISVPAHGKTPLGSQHFLHTTPGETSADDPTLSSLTAFSQKVLVVASADQLLIGVESKRR